MTHSTHTYALLDVSSEAYEEIKRKLVASGYQHVIHWNPRERDDPHGEAIDMQGIALRADPRERPVRFRGDGDRG